nr:sensor histidine kinase [Paenibacillus cymbidii]
MKENVSFRHPGGLFRRISMPRKWLLAYVLLIVVPASVLFYFYYQRSSSVLKQEVTRSMQQTLQQVALNLGNRMERVEDISNSAMMNYNLQSYLGDANGDDSIGKQLEIVKDFRQLVDSIQTNADVFKFRLFVDRSRLYAEERINFFSLDSLEERPWYNDIIEGNGQIVWTSVYKETFVDRFDEPAPFIISCARMLRDPLVYDRVAGVMMIDVKVKTLADFLDKLTMTWQSAVYLVDGRGTVVYHPDEARIGTTVDERTSSALATGKSVQKLLGGAKQADYVLSAALPLAGLRVVAEIPAAEIASRTQNQTQYTGIATLLAIFALFLVLVFVLLAFIIRAMNRRVQQVIGVIRREGIEGLTDLPSAGSGDFGMLESSVDNLVHRVRSLVEQTYRARVTEREAQLRALQAQINPHFLYNTLDTINWIAIGRGATDISQMIDALAKYFRLSLNAGRDEVSVEDELMLANVYLELQMTRFPGSFELQIDAGEGVGAYAMPKLTLQPIVENALMHGIRKKKSRTGVIRISAAIRGEELLLTVSDDGIGMDAELVRRLLAEPQAKSGTGQSGSSYGLYNVNERIKLYAGDRYGLTIESEPGVGTTVSVRLQARR